MSMSFNVTKLIIAGTPLLGTSELNRWLLEIQALAVSSWAVYYDFCCSLPQISGYEYVTEDG
jgi:hypothetical protein